MHSAIAEIFDPSTRWIIVRAFPKDSGGFEPVKVFDLYPLSLRVSKRCYSIAHNGQQFAPSRDLVALYNEAGRDVYDQIAMRLLSPSALATLVHPVYKARAEARSDLDLANEVADSIRALSRAGCEISVSLSDGTVTAFRADSETI